MTQGELDKAIRRALAIWDDWQRVTGCLNGSSYVWEIEGIITDAVQIGVQAGLGTYEPLDAELETAPPSEER